MMENALAGLNIAGIRKGLKQVLRFLCYISMCLYSNFSDHFMEEGRGMDYFAPSEVRK